MKLTNMVESEFLSAPHYAAVIPVYNSGQSAIVAVNSILAQSYAPAEVIVINDGSTDSSASLLREYYADVSDIVHIYSIPNCGAAGARNYGIIMSTAEWIAFLDSDDAWHPQKIEQQFQAIAAQPSLRLVGALTNMVGFSRIVPVLTQPIMRVTHKHLLFKNWFQTSTVIVHRDVIHEVGSFPLGRRYAEEGDFFMRITARFPAALLTTVLVDYAGGKRGFGQSGLSANLWRMEQGELSNIYSAWTRGDNGLPITGAALAFSLLKFFRRVILRQIWRFRRGA
jgi:glycosyltransferase involved in cell wall biosynthesis